MNQEGNYFLKDIDENYKHESLLVSVQLRLSYQSFFSRQRASSFLRSQRKRKCSNYVNQLACKAGGFAGGMIRKQRLRTTGRHFERANKGETGRGKKRREGGGGGEKGEKRGGGLGVRRTACPETRAK